MILEVPYLNDTVKVTFDYYKSFRGNNEEPPEPEGIDITKVEYKSINVGLIVDWDVIAESLWSKIDEVKRNC